MIGTLDSKTRLKVHPLFWKAFDKKNQAVLEVRLGTSTQLEVSGMALNQNFRINVPKVISETIDGETIIINLESGHYFSLNHSGGQIWNDIQTGHSTEQIFQLTQQRYPRDAAQVPSAVSGFLAALLSEALIGPCETFEISEKLSTPTAPADRPFEIPGLQKYEDMQDLLLLDPIHEVDEMGWPMTK